jgi:hypothetical protein
MSTTRTIVVTLSHPEQLFLADDVKPSSPDYSEFTAQPAMDTVRDMLLMRMPRKTTDIELEVVLPNDQVRSGLDNELTEAVRRWVRVQNTMDVESSQADGSIGRRLFLLGFLAFMVLQTLSIWVRKLGEDTNDFLLAAIAEALGVVSWVMLWFPVQMFTVEVWRASIKRRRMLAMERMTVKVIRSGDLAST